MKRLRNLLAVLLVASLPMLATSCGDDDDDKAPSLPGTTWSGSVTNNGYAYEGVNLNINATFTFQFSDASNGMVISSTRVEAPAYPALGRTDTDTTAFTYTFDGTTLITYDEDGEEPDSLQYNASRKAFELSVPDDEELRELVGTDVIYLKRTK